MDVIEYITDIDVYLKTLKEFLKKQRDYEYELLNDTKLSTYERTTFLSNSFPEIRKQLEGIRQKPIIVKHPPYDSKKVILSGIGKVSDIINEKCLLLNCGEVLLNEKIKEVLLDIKLPGTNETDNYLNGDARKYKIGDTFKYKVEIDPLIGNTDYEGEFSKFKTFIEKQERKILFECRSIDFEEKGVSINTVIFLIAFILLLIFLLFMFFS